MDNQVKKYETQYTIAMLLSGTIGAFVVETGQSSLTVVFIRCLIASLIIFLICLYTNKFKQEYFKSNIFIPIFISGSTLILNWYFLFKSYEYLPIGIATIIYHVKPFILMFYGVLILNDKITKKKIFFVFVSFIGFLLVSKIDIIINHWTPNNIHYLIGVILALCAAILQPISTVVIIKKLKPYPPLLVGLGQFVIGIIILLPLISFDIKTVTHEQWGFLLSIGIIHTVIMYTLMYNSIHHIPTYAISVLQFIYPITAIIIDYYIYDNMPSTMQNIGILLIIFSTLSININWKASYNKYANDYYDR